MKEYNLKTIVRAYQWHELTDEQQTLINIAKEQTDRSYCPYSHFHVGAAAKLSNGEIIRGCNQENAASRAGCVQKEVLCLLQERNIHMNRLQC